MKSKSHKYLAYLLYSEDDINKVYNNNYIISNNEDTNLDLIDINNKVSLNEGIYSNKYERTILKSKNKKYKLININEGSFNGYLVSIYDPSHVKLAISNNFLTSGESILSVSKRNKAKVIMNSVGYFDPGWNSNGAIPHGCVIKNNKILSDYKSSIDNGGFIGFNNDNKLVLKRNLGCLDALNSGYRDAVEFGPFLIVNHKKVKIVGNGGWGIAPRTAIGQRKDGIVLFLVINGRIPSSIGASMSDVRDILYKYGAYNASNLDGGSSSELVINGKIINKPVGGGKHGLRLMPTYWFSN